MFEVDVGPAGEMGSLLEEEGMWTKYLADIDGDILWGMRERVEMKKKRLTRFWAEKTEFMMGM